jgi:O-antigen/teichoic acid export membrane protein
MVAQQSGKCWRSSADENGKIMSLARKFALYSAADLLGRSIGLVTSPFLTRLLTPAQFGSMSLLSSVWAVIAITQFAGMDSSYPFFRAKGGGEQQLRKVLVNATVIATLALLTVWTLFFFTGILTEVVYTFAGVSATEFSAFALGVLPAGLLAWYLYAFRFSQWARSFVTVTLIGKVLSALLVLPALLYFTSANRLTVYYVVLGLVQWVAVVIALREFRLKGAWPYSRSAIDPSLGRNLLHYGVFLVPAAMLNSLTGALDRLLVGWFWGPQEVALLSLALFLASIIFMMKGWLSLAWDPQVIEWIGTRRSEVYLPRLQLGTEIFSVVLFLVIGGATIWADWVVHLLYPPFYAPVSDLIPPLLLWGAFGILGLVASATITLADTPKLYFRLYGIGLTMNAVFGLWLVPAHGALGAVVATLITSMCAFVVLLYWGKLKFQNMPLRWNRALFLIFLLGVLIVFFGSYLVVSDGQLLERILASAVLCGMTAFLTWVWKIPERAHALFMSPQIS